MSNAHAGTMEGIHDESRTGTYILVALILTVLTVIEVWISYVPALLPVLVPMLIVLSGAKFVLVVAFYMHLHYDSWLFTGILTPLLVLAAFIILALLGLFTRFFVGF
jgi:cytochrome c oxidase subunit 4